jgi:uncharacterized protein (DUF924 family)
MLPQSGHFASIAKLLERTDPCAANNAAGQPTVDSFGNAPGQGIMRAVTPQDVHTFWFGLDRKAWFEKDPALDEEIRRRFLALYEQGATGLLADWRQTPAACLALVILLDQFPRNMFRGSAKAFAADRLARDAACDILDNNWDKAMTPDERMFAYLPLEHSESLADQERCLALMKEIAVFPATADLPKWAEAHLVIIRRFGRFPHRNAALGRASTPEEEEFLKQPGSSF